MPELISGRSMCSILQDMRKCLEMVNFSYLDALIEEAQSRANRMEDALGETRSAAYRAWQALSPEEGEPDAAAAIEALNRRWDFKRRPY